MMSEFLIDWKESSQFRLIAWISLFILIIKLILLFAIPINPHAIEDWYIACNIAAGNGYSLSNGPTALKTPIYPLFLTPTALLGEYGKVLASALQHIMWSFATILLYKASILRFGTIFAFAATLIFALHPAYVYYPFVLESTALTVPLFICFWFLAEQAKHGTLNVKIPMLIGWLTAMTQPILMPGIVALQLLFFGKRNLPALMLTAIVIFTPWIIRNALTFEAFIPSKSPMWMNFYEGMQQDVSSQEKIHIESLRTYMNDVQLEKEYKPIVMRQFLEQFPIYIERSMHRFTEFWVIPDRYRDQMWTPKLIVSRMLPQAILGLGFIMAFFLVFRKKPHISSDDRRFLITLIGIMLYVSCVYSLTQAANIRFKLDVEWLQILLLFPIFQAFPKLVKLTGTRK